MDIGQLLVIGKLLYLGKVLYLGRETRLNLNTLPINLPKTKLTDYHRPSGHEPDGEKIRAALLNSKYRFPHLFELTPHLGSQSWAELEPEIQLTKNKWAKYVVGVSTVKREMISYLDMMLSFFLTLFESMKKPTSFY